VKLPLHGHGALSFFFFFPPWLSTTLPVFESPKLKKLSRLSTRVCHTRDVTMECIGETKQVYALCERCRKRGLAEGIISGPDIRLLLRWSRCERTDDKHQKRWQTLDVVQIGWEPFLSGEKELRDKPKRSADSVWDALEEYARREGRILYVESVMEGRLIEHLVKHRGYARNLYSSDCLMHVMM
jgi:hypothetical protein